MWHPLRYAALLADKMQQQGCQAWLVNTGGALQVEEHGRGPGQRQGQGQGQVKL
jgi:ATP-dependent phosphoenolpyruvate carboxykinase